MKLVAKHLTEGGWECVVVTGGERCRQSNLQGYKDAETHVKIDHGVRETHMPDETLDIYDVSELAVEMLRAAGAI